MNFSRQVFQKLMWQGLTLIGIGILFASPLNQAVQRVGMKHGTIIPGLAVQVKAHDIYPLFTCPCCGEPLKKEEPCCGAMVQMIDFIDQKISTGADTETVILATANEFGLERLVDESTRLALREQLLADAPKDAPKIVFESQKKDLGVVSQQDGTVTTEFQLKNEGKKDLVIDSLSSSCGCTSGSIVYQGEEGPRFYMAGHGFDNPTEAWQVVIAPGEEATVKVYYDPSVHKNLTGPVTRTLSIHSNDPVDFDSILTIILEQVL
jgi:hypothetical protein